MSWLIRVRVFTRMMCTIPTSILYFFVDFLSSPSLPSPGHLIATNAINGSRSRPVTSKSGLTAQPERKYLGWGENCSAAAIRSAACVWSIPSSRRSGGDSGIPGSPGRGESGRRTNFTHGIGVADTRGRRDQMWMRSSLVCVWCLCPSLLLFSPSLPLSLYEDRSSRSPRLCGRSIRAGCVVEPVKLLAGRHHGSTNTHHTERRVR